MEHIKIEQLDRDGKVFRTFSRHVERWYLDVALDKIARGFNLDATRVIVNGAEWHGGAVA